MTRFHLLFCLISLATATNSIAQVRAELMDRYNAFDYKTFVEKFDRTQKTTNDEKQLAAEVLYKLGDYSKADSLLNELSLAQPLSPALRTLQSDIRINMNRNRTEDVRMEISPLLSVSGQQNFVCSVEGNDLLLSASGRKRNHNMYNDIQTENTFLSLYRTSMDEDLANGEVVSVLKEKGINIGPITRYNGGYILTKNYTQKKGRNNLRLVFLDDQFNETSSFPYNDVNYSIGHAVFDSIRNRMIFVSDMPAGDGKTDLWYSNRTKSGWEAPVRMEALNTYGNEMFPTIEENTLYFSSNGRDGYGGLDIYSYDLSGSDSIKHLPAPINSRADDFGLLWMEPGTKAVLNSNRDNNSMDAVYLLTVENGTFGCGRECPNENCLQFSVNDYNNIEVDRFEFRWRFGDGSTGKGLFASHCYSEIGTYNVALDVEDLRTGEIFVDAMIQEVTIEEIKMNYPAFTLNTIRPNDTIQVLDEGQYQSDKPMEFMWESSDGQVSFEKYPKFTYEKAGYYEIKRHIRIKNEDCCYKSYESFVYVSDYEEEDVQSGIFDLDANDDPTYYKTKVRFVQPEQLIGSKVHVIVTDSEGSILGETDAIDSLELTLSHKQSYFLTATNSDNISAELTMQSIEKTELEFSYYELELSDDFNFVVLVMDRDGSPIQGARIDVGGITGTSGAAGTYGSKDDLTSIEELVVSSGGFWKDYSDINFSRVPHGDTILITLDRMEVGKTLILDNIQFDLGKHNIRPDAAIILDHVIEVLKEYPSMHIELSAHTDARGSSQSNLSLSDRRAKSARQYIISQGIDENRLTGLGYGENKLLNHCADGVRCNEELHQENRRVEVMITKM